MKLQIFGAIGLVILSPEHLDAQGVDQNVLEQIQESVVLICGEFVRSGSSETLNVDGAVSAELSRLGRLLADAGVEGEADYTTGEYIGVLREELGEELKDNRACRLTIWNDVFSRGPNSRQDGTSELAAEASRFAENSGLFHCKETQLFQVCVNSTRIRGKYADLSLSLTNVSDETQKVCLPQRSAYAISSEGEKVTNYGTECREIVSGGIESYSFDFEFTKDVGTDFDAIVFFDRPKTEFTFRGLR